MKKLLLLLTLVAFPFSGLIADDPLDTWANWQTRLDEAFRPVSSPKLPGDCMGIIVPNETRYDILTMQAFGYDLFAQVKPSTIIFLMPAPNDYPLTGLALPNLETLDTNLGEFNIDIAITSKLFSSQLPVKVENAYFTPKLPRLLETQLAFLKFMSSGKTARFRIVPILVHLPDMNAQSKDIAPALADIIKGLGYMQGEVQIVMVGNLTKAKSTNALVKADGSILNSIRSLDIDGLVSMKTSSAAVTNEITTPDLDVIGLGLLTLRCLGADHAEIMTYAHSGQLILTKDKSTPVGYVSAGVTSGNVIPPKLKHVDRERMVDIFNELLRADMLTTARQTCASILDPTAAKPPSILNREASRPWPVYVSLYDPEGNLAGQAGSHVPVGPLEESIRHFGYDAVQRARPKLTKEVFAKYVVDVSIPYGFLKVTRPEELLPYLNGVIVHFERKTTAQHPDVWRTYGDPHQILSEMCTRLGAQPWAYAINKAQVESFRVLGFNEKEPFQDLGAATRKKKNKKATDENLDNPTGDTGGGGGFTF